MNIQASINPVENGLFETDSISKQQIEQAHNFRSKVIGKCADVECWLVDQIKDYQAPSSSFAQKVQQLSVILDKNKKDFNKPENLKKYLEDFKPYSAFRSEIAHSKLTILQTGKGEYFAAFQNVQTGSDIKTTKSILLSEVMRKQIWDEMHKAANNLTNYPVTPPSSPPRQRPAATAGP
ncbi:hypothetical protein [Parasphingorhabdus sp.]|uniref:hypothetical protein n=1 Tax=Parasphingorhabdus sp. TaxID=2709688 RepID=UPI003C7762FA